MVILDGTIVNVALPTIRRSWASRRGLSWVVNGFFVAFAGLLLLTGRLGDLPGQRRVFVAGLVVFTLASAGAARPEPGVARGRTSCRASARAGLSRRARHDRPALSTDARRARAFAVFAFVGSWEPRRCVPAVLTELVSWRWVLLVNVPMGICWSRPPAAAGRQSERAEAALDVLAQSPVRWPHAPVHAVTRSPSRMGIAVVLHVTRLATLLAVRRRSARRGATGASPVRRPSVPMPTPCSSR